MTRSFSARTSFTYSSACASEQAHSPKRLKFGSATSLPQIGQYLSVVWVAIRLLAWLSWIGTRGSSGTPTRDRSHVARWPIRSGCQVELEQLDEAGRGPWGGWIRVMVKRLGRGSVGRHGDAREIKRLNWKQLMDDDEDRARGPGLGADTLGRVQASTGGLLRGRGCGGRQTEHEKQRCQRQCQSPVPSSYRPHRNLSGSVSNSTIKSSRRQQRHPGSPSRSSTSAQARISVARDPQSRNPLAIQRATKNTSQGRRKASSVNPSPNTVAGPSLAKEDGMVAPRNGSMRTMETAKVSRRKPRSRFAIG